MTAAPAAAADDDDDDNNGGNISNTPPATLSSGIPITLLSNALGSAAAGIVGRTLTHPLDTVKARLQGSSLSSSSSTVNSFRGPIDVVRQTWRTEGLRGFYRGYTTVIVAGTPGTILYLTSYDVFKERVGAAMMMTMNHNDHSVNSSSPSSNDDSFVVHFCSGILAESVACLIYVPVDVIKERLQVQQINDTVSYRGGWDALQRISQTEGVVGLYKGYGATLASFGPFSAFYFVFYEKCKKWSRNHIYGLDNSYDSSLEIPFRWIVLSSAVAGAAASFITSPLDMAKLRLQVQRGQLATATATATAAGKGGVSTILYRNMFDALHVAYRQGGIRGLFRGAGARVLHFVPATTVTMTSYETCRSFFQRHLSG